MTTIETETEGQWAEATTEPHPLEGIRVRWLNALVIGATIMVWGTLIVGAASGIVLGTALASGGFDSPTVGSNFGGTYTDRLGVTCDQADVLSSIMLCP